jgi:hypothetical protein
MIFSIKLWPVEHFSFGMWHSDQFEFETPALKCPQTCAIFIAFLAKILFLLYLQETKNRETFFKR